MFHIICTWKRKSSIKKNKKMSVGVCVPVFVAPPASTITGVSLWARLVLVYVCICVRPVCCTGAPVTQGHSCETPLIPVLRVLWVGGWSPSTAQLFLLVAPNIKQHMCASDSEGDQAFTIKSTTSFVSASVFWFFFVKVPSVWARSKPRLFLMPRSAIYMFRWVTGQCILLCMS